MMPDFIFNIAIGLKVQFIKIFGSDLQKILIRLSKKYLKLISEGILHDDAIIKIMKEEYPDDKQSFENCRYYVYNTKQNIDKIFTAKFGNRGRFMSHLFKLVQKVYIDKFLKRDNSDINPSAKYMLELNKNFNKVVLYYFSKYDL